MSFNISPKDSNTNRYNASDADIDTMFTLNRNSIVTASKRGNITEIQITLPPTLKSKLPELEAIKAFVLRHNTIENPDKWKITRQGDRLILKKDIPQNIPQESGPLTYQVCWEGTTWDVFSHHNQALDVWSKEKAGGTMKPGGTLIHFDTHSDMFLDGTNHESIADYINTAMADGTFSEVYWVLPDWTTEEGSRENFWKSKDEIQMFTKSEFKVYVRDGRLFLEDPAQHGGKKADRVVTIHKVTIDQLPSFAKNSNVSIDVDFDYFSNTGFDTFGDAEKASYNPTDQQLQDGLSTFMSKLSGKVEAPVVVTLSRSPNYTSDEDMSKIEDFFRWTVFGDKAEYIPDSASAYRHSRDEHADRETLTALYDIVEATKSEDYFDTGGHIIRELKRDPRGVLTSRGFQDILALYDSYKKDPSQANRDTLLSAIKKNLSLLDSRKYG